MNRLKKKILILPVCLVLIVSFAYINTTRAEAKGDNMNKADWKNISINGIGKIKKCVAEFDVNETQKTPYGKFKVKIYEEQNGHFTGYTNLLVKDEDGTPYCGVGSGKNIDEALNNTISSFMDMLSTKDNYTEDDFECADPFDF